MIPNPVLIMIQRHLLRHSRAIAPRCQALSRASSLTQFTSRRMPPSSLRWREAPKCYSTTNVADAPPESETTRSEQAQPASKEESPLIKELEAKDREIIDLKVTTTNPPRHLSFSQNQPSPPLHRKRKGEQRNSVIMLICRINTSARSPTSATSRISQNETFKRHETLPFRNLPPI